MTDPVTAASEIATIERILSGPQDAYTSHELWRLAPVLLAEYLILQKSNKRLIERVAAQSELLTRRAERLQNSEEAAEGGATGASPPTAG